MYLSFTCFDRRRMGSVMCLSDRCHRETMRWLVVALLLAASPRSIHAQNDTAVPTAAPVGTASPTAVVVPICDDCWCVPDNNGQGGCPALYPGLRQSFPDEWITALQSFVRAQDNPALLLEPEGCYPFQDAVNDLPANLYPQSTGVQCTKPAVTPTAVCAFQFDTSETTCQGRTYRAITYESSEAAVTDGAAVVHLGACGACSNAQDLAARMATIRTINPFSILCSSDYLLSTRISTRFDTLKDCYARNVGLTDECATLWSHFGATNAYECTFDCIPDADNNIPLNKGPPTCELSDCLACSANVFENDFNTLAGLWKSPYNAGFVDAVAYPCDLFYRIDNMDPCQGTIPVDNPGPTLAPVSPPSGAALNGAGLTLWASGLVVTVGVAALLC